MTDLNPNSKGSASDFMANAAALMEEEAPESNEEETAEEEARDPVDLVLDRCPDVTRAQLEAWKDVCIDVHAFLPSDKGTFIFRPITRLEFIGVAKEMMELDLVGPNAEMKLHEVVVQKCLLHPQLTGAPQEKGSQKAGTYPTLFELIYAASNFMSVERAIASTLML